MRTTALRRGGGGTLAVALLLGVLASLLDTDVSFHPVPGTGTMEVEIDGHAVPATWEYEAPELVEGCTVVFASCFDPVLGVTCRRFTLTMFNLYGQPGSRYAQYRVIFDAPTNGSPDGMNTSHESRSPARRS